MRIKNDRYQESYDEEVLENGLKVILWHKPKYEKSLFMMVTPFGAIDLIQKNMKGEEIQHPTGIAHFLEHKMFAMGDEDVTGLFSDLGANVNAFTSYHETAYYTSTTGNPKQPLQLLLDFVQSLDINEKTVEKEKGIIVSELHMYNEMSDQRLLMETYSSLYQKHPLRFDIGGDDESVMNTTLEQLQRCYEMNYHPSKMVLICVSGHDPQELLTWIKENQSTKTFGIPDLSETIPFVEPDEVARVEYSFHMEVGKPKVCVAYKLRGIKEPYERLRHEWSIRFLLDANFSSLYSEYQSWLDQEIINDYCGCDIDMGKDYASIMFFSETEHIDEFIALCEACMERVKQGEIQDHVLEQLKRRYYAQSIRSMNSFDDIAISYVRNLFMETDYFRTLDLLHELKRSDIVQACKHVTQAHRSVIRLLPKK